MQVPKRWQTEWNHNGVVHGILSQKGMLPSLGTARPFESTLSFAQKNEGQHGCVILHFVYGLQKRYFRHFCV